MVSRVETRQAEAKTAMNVCTDWCSLDEKNGLWHCMPQPSMSS